MNLTQRIWRVANLISLVLALLSGRIVYWQLVRGQALQPVALDPVAAAAYYHELSDAESAGPAAPVTLDTLPKPVIQRTQTLLAEIRRGTIYDRNGRVLAYDDETAEGRKVRFYVEPSLAHVVGYVSGLRTGVSGIERSFNEALLGLNRADNQIRRMVYQPMIGSDVYLTIDRRIQQAAAQALGDRSGAVVVLDGQSGAVLALVSAPTFDPNRILDEAYLRRLVGDCYEGVNCTHALLNRATQGLYVPGSTWKTVSLIAALDTGQATPETVFDVGPPLEDEQGVYYIYPVDGGVVIDRNHTEQLLSLEQAYITSANAVFGRIGHEMPAETLLAYAARLGFSRADGAAPPLEIETSAAQVANDPAALAHDNFLRAMTAIGQGELLASPLSLALVVAAVVNEGDMPRPHLLRAIRHPSGDLLRGEPGGDWASGVMQPETARQVRQMMVALAREQRELNDVLPGLTVGGKTGTAEVGQGLAAHAWFIGFAEAEGRTVAIAVVVEHGGRGGPVAVPIFAQVAEAARPYLGEGAHEMK
jgi:peptidoglycan glycosyltransferase